MDWWGWLVVSIGGLVLITNGIKALRELFAPALKLEARVTEVEKHDKKDLERFEDIDKTFKKQETTNRAMLQGMVALINHQLDGNGIQGLKDARDELLQHIITRQGE